MNQYEAIFLRRSIRQYAPGALSGAELDTVRGILAAADPLLPALPLQTHLVVEGERIQGIMSGIIGSYGKIRAPHYLVVTAAPGKQSLENVGYTLEAVVLELTAQAIATCWIGGHVKPGLLQGVVQIPEEQEPILLISLGKAAPGVALTRANPADAKRKPLDELILAGTPDANWRRYLEAVRIAPSAANSQPWRFTFDDKFVHVFQARNNILLHKLLSTINQVDMGIALRHLAIAAETDGGAVNFVNQPPATVPKGMDYCMSVRR